MFQNIVYLLSGNISEVGISDQQKILMAKPIPAKFLEKCLQANFSDNPFGNFMVMNVTQVSVTYSMMTVVEFHSVAGEIQ